MIITRTPLRISFLGGGSDYPAHFRTHGGQTLGTSIDKYSYVTVNRIAPLFGHTIRVGYSRTELANCIDEIEHPSVRECLRLLGIEGGLEINYMGDLPARTGLGSSSSFTVGLLHALHAFKGELVGRQQLAEEAVVVEQERIGERVGVQDQYTCAHGGLLHLQYAPDGGVRVDPLPLPSERLLTLQSHLMLVYTGVTRHAHVVLEEQLERTHQGLVTDDLLGLAHLVDEGIEILGSQRSLDDFGESLHAAWQFKRRLSSRISNQSIDTAYDQARAAGAIGGKLLGAGGGGFLLLFAPPETQPRIEKALALPRVPVSLESSGSSLLFYQSS